MSIQQNTKLKKGFSINHLKEKLLWCAESGSKVLIWVRDDDASQYSNRFKNYLKFTKHYSLSPMFSIIPGTMDEELPNRLIEADTFNTYAVAQHGYNHKNHENTGQKSEYGGNRDIVEVVNELCSGRDLLKKRFPHQYIPIFVPPWNRFSARLLPLLSNLDFKGISCFSNNINLIKHNILSIDANIDVMDWQACPYSCKTIDALVREFIGLLELKEGTSNYKIGILTHHPYMDNKVYKILGTFFEELSKNNNVSFVNGREIIE